MKTLGDILYADRSKFRVSEDEWLQLVRAVAGGDQRALHSLYEQTHRIVFTLIVRITMNRETAEEVTLNVFYDVWRKASTYDPANGSVVGWIMNQARSRAIDRLRFDQRRKRVNTYPHSLRPTTDIVDPQQAYLFEEQSRLLRDALEVLTPAERNAIEAAFFSELTYEQTARKIADSIGSISTTIIMQVSPTVSTRGQPGSDTGQSVLRFVFYAAFRIGPPLATSRQVVAQRVQASAHRRIVSLCLCCPHSAAQASQMSAQTPQSSCANRELDESKLAQTEHTGAHS